MEAELERAPCNQQLPVLAYAVHRPGLQAPILWTLEAMNNGRLNMLGYMYGEKATHGAGTLGEAVSGTRVHEARHDM